MSRIICTADWHLRKSVPVCRTETEEQWLDFQFEVVESIFKTARELKASVCCAGDIFNQSVPGTRVVNKLIDLLEDYVDVPFYACAGNHETPYHNNKLLIDSSFYTLMKHLNMSEQIAEHHFNGPVPEPAEITLCHHLCFPDKASIPGNIEAHTPESVADMYPESAVIICGDYHGLHSHFIKDTKQYIVVPGCITVQDADYMNYSPSVLFLDTESLENHVISLPHDPEKISRVHLEKEQARNENIDKFITMLQSRGKVSLSFSDNLKKKMLDKDIPARTKTIVKNIEEAVNGRKGI